jgi:bacillithiol biosynthesis deacetylase BshB1
MNEADVLAFGAHPDDIELGCGGMLAKLTDFGRSIVLVDMVRGELGSRGTVETRRQEANAAAKILGATARENLELEDGNLRPTAVAKRKVVEVVRRWRPLLVFIPYWCVRHPDHSHASELAYEGMFLAGLPRYKTGQTSHRPYKILYYMGWQEFDPSFIVDITDQFDRKMEAIYAYTTQFGPDDSSDPPTRLTSPETNWLIRSRMAHYGSLIGRRYGEGFLIRGRLEVDDPLALKFRSF